MNISKRLRTVLLVLALAIIAFVFLDFHLAKSATANNTSTSRVNSQVPEGYQAGGTTLYIVPAQNDPLTRTLAQTVFQRAKSSAYLSPILLDAIPQGDQYPIVLVAVTDSQFFWTPFYARSTLKTEFAFSNFEVLTAIEIPKGTTLPSDGTQPAIAGDGQGEQTDQSFGLISLPGYRSLVCDLAAKSIVGDLEKMVQVK
ncbi:hypothetical protein FDZ74_04005 [bacterium]|nr:MAG: hypothetical protein FDZ74_04005 [bacterium]